MKKRSKLFISLFVAFIFTFIFFNYTFAQEQKIEFIDEPNLQIPIPTVEFSKIEQSGGIIDVPFLSEYIRGIYQYGVAIGSIIAVVMIMVGGLIWLTAGGSATRVGRAKETITGAVIGLLLLLGSYTVLYTINPDLINLEAIRIQTISRDAYILEGEFSSADASGGSSAPAVSGQLPNYKQCASAWKCYPYNGTSGSCTQTKCGGKGENMNNICASGCGITSLAMVISFYGTGLTPINVADWLKSKGYRNSSNGPIGATCSGISHVAICEAAKNWGLKCEKVSKTTAIDLLKKNRPIIMHARKKGSPNTCKFTKGGHYIVLRNYENNKININDPGSNSAARASATESEVFDNCKNAGLLYIHN